MVKDGDQPDSGDDEPAGNQGNPGNKLAQPAQLHRGLKPLEPAIDDDTSDEPTKQITRSVKRFVRVSIVVNTCIAVATIAQAITSYCALKGIDHQIEIAAAAVKQTGETVKLDQRAWLNIQVPVFGEFGVGKPFEGTIQLRNSGKMPGTIVKEGGFLFTYPPSDLPPGQESPPILRVIANYLAEFGHAPRTTVSGFIVGPGETNAYPLSRGEDEQPITEKIVAGLREGRISLVFFKAYEYRDPFGDFHHSWSFFMYDLKSATWKRQGDLDHMD